jgi:hypothetical protein
VVARWITSEEQVEGENWEGLAKKMKIPVAKKKLSDAVYKIKVLNYLGSKGWELIGIQSDSQPGSWTFKRQISK